MFSFLFMMSLGRTWVISPKRHMVPRELERTLRAAYWTFVGKKSPGDRGKASFIINFQNHEPYE